MHVLPRRWTQQLPTLMSALLPSCCALCGMVGRRTLCAGCHAQYFSRSRPRCLRCALPLASHLDADNLCGDCLTALPAFDATVTAADYSAPIDQLVLGLKFCGRLAHAPLCARMLRDALLQRHDLRSAPPTRLVAVPLGMRRLAERGFNQSLEIARPLARALGVPLQPSLLLRLRDTRAQTLLTPDERRRNMQGAFAASSGAASEIRGQHVGVVDDVMTTGSTLNELAKTLKQCGAARVTNLVFARTLP
jgi:ComF family protein